MVGEPSITRIATSSLPLNPMATANGKKMAGRATSLINVAAIVGLIFLIALRPSKPAPTTRRAIGVAVLAMFVIALYGIVKASPVMSIPRREKGSPATFR